MQSRAIEVPSLENYGRLKSTFVPGELSPSTSSGDVDMDMKTITILNTRQGKKQCTHPRHRIYNIHQKIDYQDHIQQQMIVDNVSHAL